MGGTEITTGGEDSTGGSTVIPMISEGLEIELFYFDTDSATLNRDSLQQVVEIVIGGIPTGLEVHFVSFSMSLG
jgi:hypothetical protein